MKYSYRTSGTCSAAIEFEIDEKGCLHDIHFYGGCPGNTTGITKLAEGADAAEVARLLRGTDCRGRGTSCPDQLAHAIEEALSAPAT